MLQTLLYIWGPEYSNLIPRESCRKLLGKIKKKKEVYIEALGWERMSRCSKAKFRRIWQHRPHFACSRTRNDILLIDGTKQRSHLLVCLHVL